MIVALIHGSSMWSIRLGSGMSTRVVQLLHHAVGAVHAIDDGWRGRDQIEVEFAGQPLLDDLQVQQAQETAAEAEAEGGGGLRVVVEAARR